MNPIATDMMVTILLKLLLPIIRSENKLKRAEMVKGKTQYPKIQILWKKDILPPRSWAFTVTTAAPHQTITNTVANTKDAELAGAPALRIIDNSRHTKSGPHKSPIINNIRRWLRLKKNAIHSLSLVSTLWGLSRPRGMSTIFNLETTWCTSLIWNKIINRKDLQQTHIQLFH